MEHFLYSDYSENYMHLNKYDKYLKDVLNKKGLCNVLFSGETGSGKTSLIKNLCYKNKKDLLIFDLSEIVSVNSIEKNIEKIKKNDKSVVLLDNIESLSNMDEDLVYYLLRALKKELDNRIIFGEIDDSYEINENIEEDLYLIFNRYFKVDNFNKKESIEYLNKIIKIDNFGINNKLANIFVSSLLNFDCNIINELFKHINKEKIKKSKNKVNELLLKYFELRYIVSLRKNDLLSKEKKLEIARHEIGHLFAAIFYKMKLNSVLLHDCYTFNGFCMADLPNDGSINNRNDLIRVIGYNFGGIISEEYFYSEFFSGSIEDLKNINDYFEMMLNLGFSKSFGSMGIESKDMTEAMKDYFLKEKTEIIKTTKQEVTDFINKNKNIFDKSVNKLLKKNILNNKDCLNIAKKCVDSRY